MITKLQRGSIKAAKEDTMEENSIFIFYNVNIEFDPHVQAFQ